jgi:hypothetical protein
MRDTFLKLSRSVNSRHWLNLANSQNNPEADGQDQAGVFRDEDELRR